MLGKANKIYECAPISRSHYQGVIESQSCLLPLNGRTVFHWMADGYN